MSTGEKIATGAPFLAAILIALGSPELNRAIRNAMNATLQEALKTTSSSQIENVPPHLKPDSIYDYVEYAGDAAQLISATFLTLIGILVLLLTGLPLFVGVVLIVVGIPVDLFILLRVLTADPFKYISHKIWGRYSPLTIVGMTINFTGIILVIFVVQ